MNWPMRYRFEEDRFVTVDRAGRVTVHEGVGVADLRALTQVQHLRGKNGPYSGVSPYLPSRASPKPL
jgi:hypothetical protein